MATESVDDLENLIGKSLGWVKYDKPEDYEMSPFGGMWVESDGKSAHDISGLVVALHAYYTRECARKVLEGRIGELEQWNAYGHPNFHQSDDLMQRIDALKAQLRAAIKEVGGGDGKER